MGQRQRVVQSAIDVDIDVDYIKRLLEDKAQTGLGCGELDMVARQLRTVIDVNWNVTSSL